RGLPGRFPPAAIAVSHVMERRHMKRILVPALTGLALLGLSACNNNDNNTAPFSGDVRVVNGIPDSGSVTASATSGFSNTSGVGFDHASSTVTIPEGSYNVQLRND